MKRAIHIRKWSGGVSGGLMMLLCVMTASLRATVTLSFDDVYEYEDPTTKQSVPTVFSGDSFTLKIEIVQQYGIGTPHNIEIQGVSEFKSIAQSDQQTLLQQNGAVYVSTAKLITFLPDHKFKGAFTIGPAKVVINGQEEQSNSLTFTIRERLSDEKVSSSQRQRHASGGVDMDEARATLTLESTQPITAATPTQSGQTVASQKAAPQQPINSKKTNELYVGEPAVVTFTFMPPSHLLDMRFNEAPKLDDFYIKPAAGQNRSFKKVNGKDREVHERSYLIIPRAPGSKEIPSFSLVYLLAEQMMPGLFVGGREKYISTNSLPLTIKPLPPHTKQIDLVGRVDRFSLKVSKNHVTVNEPFKCTLELAGLFDSERFDTPTLTLPASFRSYDSTSSVHDDKRNLLNGGSKEFEFVLQAGKAGEYHIEPQQLCYFDITTKKYKTIKTERVTLQVVPSAHDAPGHEQTGLPASEIPDDRGSSEAKVLDTKLAELPCVPAQPLPRTWGHTGLPWILFFIHVALPIIFFYGIPAIKSLRRRYRDRLYALSSIKDRTTHELKNSGLHSSGAPLYNVFMKYFSLRYNVSLTLMSEEWIEHHLLQNGWSKVKVANFLAYLHTCASGAFTSSNRHDTSVKQLQETGLIWLNELELTYEHSVTQGME